MTFKDKLLSDMEDTFLNTDEFAETISYTPYGSTAKSIKAIVNRSRINPNAQDQNRTVATQIEVRIAKDATIGVASITRGQDTLSTPAFISGANVTWRVVDIISHDDGSWKVLAQR